MFTHKPSARLILTAIVAAGLLGWLSTYAPWPAGPVAIAQDPDPSGDGGDDAPADGGGGLPPLPEPQGPGLPKSWEAGLTVSPYSMVNLSNGNLVTVIPIIGWSGLGPDLSFSLYHNSLTAPDYEPPGGGRLDLGPGWSSSYSAHILGDHGDPEVVLVEDDGSTVTFTWNGNAWVPEPGYYMALSYDQGTGEWTLTAKNQSRCIFTFDGTDESRLEQVIDSADNVLLVHRPDQSERIDYIRDATGRELRLSYDAQTGLLSQVEESFQLEDDNGDPYTRGWSFQYDESSRLERIADPESHSIAITAYDVGGRILSIADKEENVCSYAYGGPDGRTSSVTDPYLSGQDAQYDQSFTYRVLPPIIWPLYRIQTTHTDRRGSDWRYIFDYDQTRRDLQRTYNPLGHLRRFGHDSDHNLTGYYNELGKHWTFEYDDNGNMTKMIDPESDPLARAQWTYDTDNNLTSATDALGNIVTFVYSDPTDPTNLTEIHEPADGQGNPQAVTTLTYYSDGTAKGQLHTVTDANDVTTEFEYDDYGQLAEEIEEWTDPNPDRSYRISRGFAYDAATRLYWSGWNDPSRSGGQRSAAVSCENFYSGSIWHFSPGNRIISSECCTDPGAWGGFGERWPPTPPPGHPQVPGIPYELIERLCKKTEAEHDRMQRATYYRGGWSDPSTGEWWDPEGGGGPGQGSEQIVDWVYDELGRLTYMRLSTSAPMWWTTAPPVVREWNLYYDYFWTMDPVEQRYYVRVEGPDEENTRIYFDAADRVAEIRRSGSQAEMSAACQYYPSGLPQTLTYSNGTVSEYTYDDAMRLTGIVHRDAAEDHLQLNYTYTANNLIDYISENSGAATIDFTYDSRGRLIFENRTGQHQHRVYYEYDQVGNRLRRAVLFNGPTTFYHYTGHRLLDYKTYDGYFGQEPGGDENLLETVWYRYHNWNGNVSRVITRAEGDPEYHGLGLTYDRNDRLWIVTADRWREDPWGTPTSHELLWAREYRYGFTARQRVLERERFPYRIAFPCNAWTEVREAPGEDAHQYAQYSNVDLGLGMVTWQEAQTLAESYGGYLVCVNDEDELEWLNDPSRLGDPYNDLWIGARQDRWAAEPGEGWEWVDGRPFDWPTSPPGSYPWAPGQPDDPTAHHDVAWWQPGEEDDSGWYDADEGGYLDQVTIERETVHDPSNLYPDGDGNAVWTGYLSDMPYGEFTVNPDSGAVTFGRAYLGPFTHLDEGAEPVYYHHDHLGTTRLLTQQAQEGYDLSTRVYTAFGELIESTGSADTRYGYVGGWGYEELGEIPFLHVGERCYDPGSGRFLQRDPIGVFGGLNVYGYVANNPVSGIDPEGLALARGFPGYPDLLHGGFDWEGWIRWQQLKSQALNGKKTPKPPGFLADADPLVRQLGLDIAIHHVVDESIFILGTIGMVSAGLFDLVATGFGAPWYPNSPYEFGDCTRGVIKAMNKLYRKAHRPHNHKKPW